MVTDNYRITLFKIILIHVHLNNITARTIYNRYVFSTFNGYVMYSMYYSELIARSFNVDRNK